MSALSDDVQRPIFLPAGVASPDKHAGYVADASGIDALELPSGTPIWRSEIAARPLIVNGTRLAVVRQLEGRANALQLVVLDRNQKGSVLLESDPLLFPSWVSVRLVPDETFRYSVWTERADLAFEWAAHARYKGGAPPPGHVQAQAGQTARGMARIDLETGKVQMLSAEPRRDATLPPDLQQASFLSYQLGVSDVWTTEPWEVDGDLAAIVGEISDETQTLHLQKWNPTTGDVQPPIRLVKGQALVSHVTPDGRFLLIHSEVTTDVALHGKDPWWLFSVVTGKPVAVLDYEQGATDACVLDAHLYYIVEIPPPADRRGGETLQSTLKAVDIASGDLLWQRLLSPRRTTSRSALRQ